MTNWKLVVFAAMLLYNGSHHTEITYQKPTGNNIVSWSEAAVSIPRLSMHSDPAIDEAISIEAALTSKALNSVNTNIHYL